MKMKLCIPLLCLLLAGCATNGTYSARKPIRVLIVGGGSSHDFDRWFNQADTAMLRALGKVEVSYTDKTDSIVPMLKSLDVLFLSNNQPFTNAATRQAILDFADRGKGLMLVHAAIWYNWNDWPEYNRVLAAGGSRGHDRLGEFEVTVTNLNHPLMRDVPAHFTITDELYWFEHDRNGTPIQVLATAHSKQKDKIYPMVFVVQHPKARIACIALGHDGKAHDHPAYKQLLENAVLWTAKSR